MLSPEKNARTLSRRLEVPRALRAFVRARESSLLFLGAGVGTRTDRLIPMSDSGSRCPVRNEPLGADYDGPASLIFLL
jgi:hypothetical protein